jgi:hypothetical protein
MSPSTSSTPTGLQNVAASKKIRHRNPAARPGPIKPAPKQHLIVPSMTHYVPTAYANNDQYVAKLLGCQTMGDYHQAVRGQGDKITEGATFFRHFWLHIQTHLSLSKISILKFIEDLDEFLASKPMWDLIQDGREDHLITKEEIIATGNPQYTSDGPAVRAVARANTIKTALLVLAHFDNYLNEDGSYAGHSQRDWVVAYMVFTRVRQAVSKMKAGSTAVDFVKSATHRRDQAPQFEFHLHEEPGEDEADNDAGDASEEEEDELVHFRIETEDEDVIETDVAVDDDNMAHQLDELEKFTIRMNALEGRPFVNSKGRNIRIRTPLTNKEKEDSIRVSKKSYEVLEDGNHPRLTKVPLTVSCGFHSI